MPSGEYLRMPMHPPVPFLGHFMPRCSEHVCRASAWYAQFRLAWGRIGVDILRNLQGYARETRPRSALHCWRQHLASEFYDSESGALRTLKRKMALMASDRN
jgi:hypothetical protein